MFMHYLQQQIYEFLNLVKPEFELFISFLRDAVRYFLDLVLFFSIQSFASLT